LGMMIKSEITWNTFDGIPQFVRIWRPDGETQAAICLLHGLGEHSGRYLYVAERLTAAGYAVVAPDLRGHGRSGGQRGHIPSYAAILADIDQLLGQSTDLFPGLPLFLYGHSMGGNLAINYPLRRSSHLDPALRGVIATSPWLRLSFEPSAAKVALARALSTVWPSLSQANGLAVKALSHDPAVTAAYLADPLVHDRISARAAVAIMSAGAWAIEHAQQFPLPLLLMHGGDDHITSAPASAEFARRAGPRCTFRLWPGLYHETHNEPEREKVLDFTIGWLDHQLKAGT